MKKKREISSFVGFLRWYERLFLSKKTSLKVFDLHCLSSIPNLLATNSESLKSAPSVMHRIIHFPELPWKFIKYTIKLQKLLEKVCQNTNILNFEDTNNNLGGGILRRRVSLKIFKSFEFKGGILKMFLPFSVENDVSFWCPTDEAWA